MVLVNRVRTKDSHRMRLARAWLTRPASEPSPYRAPAHDPVVVEFLNSARLAIVVTSMATARRVGLRLKYFGAVRAYLPTPPRVFLARHGTGRVGPIPSEFQANLQEYYARLAFLSALSDLPDDVWRSGDVVRSDPEWCEFEQAWCRLCGLASAVTFYAEEHCLDGDAAVRGAVLRMRQLLRSAKDGGHPCVSRGGAVFVPGWLDRRHQERLPLGWRIELEVNGTREHATLNDLSTTGMGIANCRQHPVGAEVIAHLSTGRCLVGRVQWSEGDRLGAVLLSSLPPTDALLEPHRVTL
jgi:hypothetical protein